jgi:hypothetical protein
LSKGRAFFISQGNIAGAGAEQIANILQQLP